MTLVLCFMLHTFDYKSYSGQTKLKETIFWENIHFGYCYHLVNVISLTLDQSDHSKRLPL
jgi:hypothetical protein